MDKAEFEQLKQCLDRAKIQGANIMSFCPVHPDGKKHGNRSLSLHPTAGLHCFAGCTDTGEGFKAVRDALLARQNIRPLRKIDTQPVRKEYDAPGPERLVAQYEYRDTDGTLKAVKGRFETPMGAKSFKWRKPDTSEWSGGVSMREMPLWGADLVAAAPEDRPVFFTEGEKACEALRTRGLLAVSAGGGASQVDFGTSLDVLHQREVWLWPDNDEAGRKYMARVGVLLRGKARVKYVRPSIDLPEKGDAYDYFAAGGTIEGLNQPATQATTEYLADDGIMVRVPTDTGPVSFLLTHIESGRGRFEAELEVRLEGFGFEDTPYTQRINTLSSSARDSLKRDLADIHGKTTLPWAAVINTGLTLARQKFQSRDSVQDWYDIARRQDSERFLIQDLVPLNEPTIIFGDGSAGKTFLAYRLGLSIATGHDFLGRTAMHGNVMVIDWENSKETFAERLDRLAWGMGLQPYPGMVYRWPARESGLPMVDLAQAIKERCATEGVVCIINDSVGPACSGEPEKADVALAYFRALSRINVTSINIAHVTGNDARSGSSDRPFGSTFWHNMARRTWFVKRVQEENSPVIDLGVYCRKVNDGRKPPPIGITIDFNDIGDRAIRFDHGDIKKHDALQQERPLKIRIIDHLTSPVAFGGKSYQEIAEAIGSTADSVRHEMQKPENKGAFIAVSHESGKTAKWGVKAS